MELAPLDAACDRGSAAAQVEHCGAIRGAVKFDWAVADRDVVGEAARRWSRFVPAAPSPRSARLAERTPGADAGRLRGRRAPGRHCATIRRLRPRGSRCSRRGLASRLPCWRSSSSWTRLAGGAAARRATPPLDPRRLLPPRPAPARRRRGRRSGGARPDRGGAPAPSAAMLGAWRDAQLARAMRRGGQGRRGGARAEARVCAAWRRGANRGGGRERAPGGVASTTGRRGTISSTCRRDASCAIQRRRGLARRRRRPSAIADVARPQRAPTPWPTRCARWARRPAATPCGVPQSRAKLDVTEESLSGVPGKDGVTTGLAEWDGSEGGDAKLRRPRRQGASPRPAEQAAPRLAAAWAAVASA